MTMSKVYNPKQIEKKWQTAWDKAGVYNTKNTSKAKTYYTLVEFPFPSGDGLHVGHVRSYAAMDIVSRKRRMQGYNVLFPIGWDAFGLPTENYAIKTGIHPAVVTKKNTNNFRKQMRALGLSFDWNREVNTSDPSYYKWTQWMFLQFLKKGLAYKAEVPINWCPKDKIGLANEEVVGGACERCGTPVEKKIKNQWMIRITAYADKLLAGLEKLDFLPEIKKQQEHWIGRAEGARIQFPIFGSQSVISVFTTRPETIFGATYLVLSPEHELIDILKPQIKNYTVVNDYCVTVVAKQEEDRVGSKEKTGVRVEGVEAVNPATGERIPVYVADYVLSGYGTGAIMAVPAHDQRDFEFAQKYSLPIKIVISRSSVENSKDVFEGNGRLVNSGNFSGRDCQEAKSDIIKKVGGRRAVTYKLRDWVFSRQRYWGEPIPVVICGSCGYVPVPEKDLPVVLPNVKDFKPRDDGQSPLASVATWVNVKCPNCKKPAHRETDVMPNWAGSSWYFLRYTDPCNTRIFADKKLLKKFMPVDWYNGGMEHVTLHLLYSRFWNQFLYDCGFVLAAEPYRKRTAHGVILAGGGVKMSKSKGNVINPDQIVASHGADTLRLYEMFMGPFDQAVAWDFSSIEGVSRFLGKVWRIHHEKVSATASPNRQLTVLLHKTIKSVSDDIESMRFNTAVSACMIFVNACFDQPVVPVSLWKKFLLILAPFAPHITEELWQSFSSEKKFSSIHTVAWPRYNPQFLITDSVTIPIQINGKMRDQVIVPVGSSQDHVFAVACEREKLQPYLRNASVRTVIFVPDKIMNIVL
ncbi:MAG: hypothetical protein RIQ54_208 [Candidatus Parcubacteria bacterium]|jgi:leucyl-tRNA synthetase